MSFHPPQVAWARSSISVFLGLLLVTVFYQLVTGRMTLAGVWNDKGSASRPLSASRVQLLVLTLVGALYYLAATLRDPGHFPALPPGAAAAFLVSHGLYLGDKFRASARGATTASDPEPTEG